MSDMRCPRAVPALILLAAVGLCVAGNLSAQRAPSDPVGYFQDRVEALRLYDGERWGAAESLLSELVRDYPADAELWFRLARTRHRLGRPRGAIHAYRESFELGYRYGAWIPLQVSRLYAGLDARDSSLVWLDRALEERWGDRSGLASDSAYRALREDPRFLELAGRRESGDLDRAEGWRRDLDHLVGEVHRLHVTAAGEPDVPARFDSAARELRERIPGLTNDRILLELGRLMALLGDGHTGIYGPDEDTPLEFRGGSLPLLFYLFDDGLYVVDAAEGAERWIGSRVRAFGEMPAERVLDRLPEYVHHNNPMTVRWLGVRFRLPTLSFLEAVGAAEGLSAATLTLEDPDSTVHRPTLEAGDHVRSFRRKLRPAPGREADPPLYLRRVDDPYWATPLPAHDAFYFQFNQVRNAEEGPTIARFSDSLRRSLAESGAKHLIVDVRHNNGGNNGLLRPLVRTLIWWEQDAPDRTLYVITGRNTFSAAQNFVSRIERWTDALFVGEPSSSRPNFGGEETGLLLPYSRVRGSISNRYWQDSDPDDQRRWIAPDIPVPFRAADYFGGRDPAFETIVRVIDGR